MSKAKYKQGRKICSIADFASSESVWYKLRNKTVHRAILVSWQYRTLQNTINAGVLFTAELIEPQKEGEE